MRDVTDHRSLALRIISSKIGRSIASASSTVSSANRTGSGLGRFIAPAISASRCSLPPARADSEAAYPSAASLASRSRCRVSATPPMRQAASPLSPGNRRHRAAGDRGPADRPRSPIGRRKPPRPGVCYLQVHPTNSRNAASTRRTTAPHSSPNSRRNSLRLEYHPVRSPRRDHRKSVPRWFTSIHTGMPIAPAK